MSDFPAAGSTHTPDNAIEAAARVIHSLTCGECDYHPDQLTQVSAVDREDARRVLAAAAPVIAAHAAAAERERFAESVRQELEDYFGRCVVTVRQRAIIKDGPELFYAGPIAFPEVLADNIVALIGGQ